MRFLVLVLLAGCSSTSSTAPTTPAAAAPAEAVAPIPFTAEQIRDAMPPGTELKLRVASPGKPTVIQHWVVLRADAETGTIASRLLDENGELVQDEGAQTSRWQELREHAKFPADKTTVTDATVTVPAGTFPTKLYEVREGSTVKKMHFAPALPGPPIDMVVEVDGKVVMHMTLLERR